MDDESASGSTDRARAGPEASGTDLVADTRPISEADQLEEFGDLEAGIPKVAPGQSLGRYVILRQLAAGGMSVVYVAYDPELNREVALKVMRPGGPEGDVLSSERLLREAQAMARLSHVNVVHVYDVGVVEGRVYMAMEFVRGETFEEWLAAEDRPWPAVIDVLVRAGRGLAAAHAAGLVHLDFKPRNVLVGDDGEVRVVDFGLARPPRSFDSAGDQASAGLDEERIRDLMTTSGRLIEPITQYGTVMGTPGYMAAEQLAAEAADARSDQFAFCATAWVALFRTRPFAGETARELNHEVMIGAVQPPPVSRSVPPRIRRLLERGLRNDPDERHPSLDVLLDALDEDRTRPVRRVVLGAGALALVAAVSYGLAQAGKTGPRCDGARSLLAGVWDAERKRAVTEAINADGRSFAVHVAQAVTASLDEWTADWVEMHNDSCEATHVRGEQSPELLDLRTRCLRRGLGELRALTDTLLAADATTVERATEAVGRLVPVDKCTDVERLTATMPALEPERAAQVDAIFDRMAVGVALQGTGQYPLALVPVLEAELAAELLGHAPLTVHARHAAGTLLMEIGASEVAVEMFTEALYAAETAGLDSERLAITLELVFILGLHRGEFAQAHRVARHAAALADRLDVSADRRSRLMANEGAVYGAEGRSRESIARYEEALRLQAELPEPAQANLASIHLGLGAAYHLLADYEQGLGHFVQARDLMVAAYGEEHPRAASAYENIGTAYQAMGRFEDAKEQFRIAWKINTDALVTDVGQASLLVGLAAAHEGLEEYEEAAEAFERVIDTLSAVGLETPTLAVAMGNLAGIYVETERYDDALALYGEQLPLLERITGSGHVYAHYFRVGKARALRGLGRDVDALEVIGPVVEAYRDRIGEIDPLHRGEAVLVLARALHAVDAAEIPEGAASRLAAGSSVEALLSEARNALTEAGVSGERPLRRVAAFGKQLRQRKKADRPLPP